LRLDVWRDVGFATATFGQATAAAAAWDDRAWPA